MCMQAGVAGSVAGPVVPVPDAGQAEPRGAVDPGIPLL